VTYTPAANYIGADSFTFKARDSTADSNVATVSITISADIAKTPTERIQDLIEHIRSLHLRQGTENSVTAKLNAAIQSLERGNTHSAKNQLNACIHEIAAQTGKTITDEHVASLAANIQQINQLL
jgi:predicted negative regulator of RcsB-dependent stress response